MGRKPETIFGLDEQESDTRPSQLGKGAMDSDARYTFGNCEGKSGKSRNEQLYLTPGGLEGLSLIDGINSRL